MTLVSGARMETVSSERIRSTLADVLEAVDTSTFPERLLAIPDVEYPFHPTSGMVTNPDVISGLMEVLEDVRPDVDLAIAYPDGRFAEGARTAGYLGLPGNSDESATGKVRIIDLDDASRTERTVQTSDGARTVAIPEPMLTRGVVTIPTLRYGRQYPIAGGLELLARPFGNSTAVPTAVAGGVDAVRPVLSVLDGTYTYTGRPQASRFLAAGRDAVSVDALAARLAGFDPEATSPLAETANRPDGPIRLRGISLEEIRERLPNEGRPGSAQPGSIARTGYKLYTHLTGDAYPPQFER